MKNTVTEYVLANWITAYLEGNIFFEKVQRIRSDIFRKQIRTYWGYVVHNSVKIAL